MLGVVFTEFMDLVADKFGADMVDDILEDVNPESDGAYTAVGTYDYTEMVALVSALSARTGTPVAALQQIFGENLLERFLQRYPAFFAGITDPFDFLETVDGHVHKEVKKLYPEAELPSFNTTRPDANTFVMEYASKRPFSALAKGLIEGTMAHYGQKYDIDIVDKSESDFSEVTFTIRKHV
ncbi:MAG: heme NO-binding domain-containing protein [Magnetospiraceae bacterium]